MPFRKKKFQFSLRAVLLAVLLVSMALHWFIYGPNARKWRVVHEIEAAGGTVLVEKAGPDWLRSVTGDSFVDFFCSRPYSVFAPREFQDEDLQRLSSLVELETLSLEGTSITDAGLSHLYGHQQLLLLNLQSTRVTDIGKRELEMHLPATIISR